MEVSVASIRSVRIMPRPSCSLDLVEENSIDHIRWKPDDRMAHRSGFKRATSSWT